MRKLPLRKVRKKGCHRRKLLPSLPEMAHGPKSTERPTGGKHPSFLAYMVQIADHPSYAGMPDLINAKGEIQWEAPSNRKAGQFKDTHHRRRDWWRKKAEELGINTTGNQWISKTAKLLHPTKKKPCSVCGKVMDIRYVYPTGRLKARIRQLPFLRFDYFIPDDEDIFTLVKRLYSDFGPAYWTRCRKCLR